MILIKKYTKSIRTLVKVVMMLFLFIPNAYSQESVLDSIISYEVRNQKLSDALENIAQKINYDFSYNVDLISTNRLVNSVYSDVPLVEILENLINDTTISFQVVDQHIVIYKDYGYKSMDPIVQDSINKYNYITINGQILDNMNGESLPFANISIKGRSFGTITNEEGYFSFKFPNSYANSTIIVTYLGYKNAEISVSKLSKTDNIIYLEKDVMKLQEVVIRNQNPQYILSKAIQNIKDNYYHDPYNITAFYRETVKKKNELASISEAVIDIYKSPYSGFFSDQIKLLKSRKKEYYSNQDSLEFKLKGGLYSTLFLDIIKSPKFFVQEENFHLYEYRIEDIVMYNNTSAYIIRFKPKYYIKDNTYEGRIYINSQDLTILLFEIKVTDEAIRKLGKSLVVKEAKHTNVRPSSVKYTISYRKIGNKYFLNLVKGELDFKVRYKRKLLSTNYKTIFELATNDIDTVNVERFSRRERMETDNVFIDENYQYDSEFWENYNYLRPNESLEDALIRIKRKLKNLKD